MKQSFLIFLLVALMLPGINGGAINPQLAAKLQAALDSTRKSLKLEGASAAVNINGVTWQGASGNSYNGHPITTDMEFCIGSDTKLFISVMLLKLQEKGILSLDDSLYRWLPPIKNVDSTITIRQMLNHTSGIADYLGSLTGFVDSVQKNESRRWTPWQLVRGIGTPYFPKGTNWVYSNSDYILAAMVIKAATHDTLTRQLHTLLLDPLQLGHTYLDAEDTLKGIIPDPWENGYNIKSYIYNPRTAMSSMLWTAGGMYSTARNMADWYQALFNGNVLSASSMNQLLTFVSCYPLYGLGYGLGVAQDTSNGRNILRHGGAIFGYLSRNLYDSLSRASIFALVNQDGIDPQPIVAALHKIIIGYQKTGIEDAVAYGIESEIYPNPFSDEVNIGYSLKSADAITIKIMDLTGKVIAMMPQGLQLAGKHTLTWNSWGIPAGLYLLCIDANRFRTTNKLIVKSN